MSTPTSETVVRGATPNDRAAAWRILAPVIRAGETLALRRDMDEGAALDYWFATDHAVFAATSEGRVVGSYYLRANQSGGGDHIANAGYVVDPVARGQGIARAMAEHSLATGRARGFAAMQFNFVVATNTVAVGLRQRLEFAVVGTLPAAFRHPAGMVDALVMVRRLDRANAL